ECQELAVARIAQRFLHRVHVGRSDPADDWYEAVSDPCPRGRLLDFGGERLIRLFAIGPVVDQHSDALIRQPGDFMGSDLPAHKRPLVKLADHGLTGPARPSAERAQESRARAEEPRLRPGWSPARLPLSEVRRIRGTAGCRD